ncbi:hypothetical protein UlMin_041213 [Ulmus minor]
MEAEKNMASFLNPNVQLDRFDGTNLSAGKLFFLITILKIAYVLDPNLQPLPEPDDIIDTDKLKVERKKRVEDEVMCRGHILNTLSEKLYDFYNSMKTPKEIWTALEYKYKAEKEGTDKFLIFKYFEFTMVETKPTLDQIHELKIMVTKLRELNVEIYESFQVGAIITKLPSRNNRKRKNDQKNNNTNNKFKKISSNKKKISGNFFHHGKKGHCISDCKFRKKWFLE